MERESKSQLTVPNATALILQIQGLALEFPHRAICSYHEQSNTYFYNVYFQSAVDQFLDSVEPDLADIWTFLPTVSNLGYNISIKRKNKAGFCQCTFSYSVPGTKLTETHLLSGEGGTVENAITSALMKHILIQNPDGQWNFSLKMDSEKRKFR